MEREPDLLPGGGSESQEHVTQPLPQPIMAPPGHGFLTTAMHGVCKTCVQIKPIVEFMSRPSTHVFKNCTPCRRKNTLAFNRTRARRDARLAAQIRAQTTQDQNPVQPHGLTQSQIPIQNAACPQIPLSPFTMVNESNFVISGLLRQRSFANANPCVPGGSLEEIKYPGQTVSDLQPHIKSEEMDSNYGDHDDEDGDDDINETTTVSTPAFFRCLHCGIARSAGLEYSGICIYCFEHEVKYCIAGDHETDRPEFVDADGVEYEDCNGCRGGGGHE